MINMKRIRIRKSILILGIVILVLAIGFFNRKYFSHEIAKQDHMAPVYGEGSLEGWKFQFDMYTNNPGENAVDKTNSITSIEHVFQSNYEYKYITLQVSYTYTGQSSFDPNTLKIYIPKYRIGSKNNLSNEIVTATTNVAAGTAADGYDWNYTIETIDNNEYYVFTNNKKLAVEEGKENLEGMFQIAYAIRADMIYIRYDSATQQEKPSYKEFNAKLLNTADDNTLLTDTKTVTMNFPKADYTIKKQARKITSLDGLPSNDYIWVNYKISASPTYETSNLRRVFYHNSYSREKLLIKEVLPSDDCIILDDEMNELTSDTDEYYVKGKASYSGAPSWSFYIGYPTSEYEDETITNTAQFYGQYTDASYDDMYDTSYPNNYTHEIEYITEDSVEVKLSDFKFEYPPGNYGLIKHVYNSSYTGYKQKNDETLSFQKIKNDNDAERFYIRPITTYTGTSLTVRIGDDREYIESADGTKKEWLSDNDYYFSYIYIPILKNGNGNPIKTYQAKLFVRYAGTNNYVLYSNSENTNAGIFDTSAEKTFSFSETNIVGWYIEIYNMKESIMDAVSLYTDVNYSKEDIGEIGTEGYLYNFAYIDVYDDQGNLLNGASEESYTGTGYNDGLAQWDYETYGHYPRRDYAYVRYLPSKEGYYISKYIRDSKYQLDRRTNTVGLEIHKLSQNGYKKIGPITKIDMYDLLPAGMYLDNPKIEIVRGSNYTYYLINGEAFSSGNQFQEFIESHTSYEVKYNWNNTGRTWIHVYSDFTDVDFQQIAGINSDELYTAKLKVSIPYESIPEYGLYYVNYAYINLEPGGVEPTDNEWEPAHYYSEDRFKDSGYFDSDAVDINEDGSTTDLLNYSSSSTTLLEAYASQGALTKYVRSYRMEGNNKVYNNEWASSAITELNGHYEYKNRFYNSTESSVTNVVLYDNIESYYYDTENHNFVPVTNDNKWQGTFDGVDTSYLESKGYTVRTYYSTNEQAGPLKSGVIINDEWKLLTSLDTVNYSRVKSLAFEILNSEGQSAIIIPDTTLYVTIQMKAPNNVSAPKTYNGFWTEWNAIDSNGQILSNIDGIYGNIVEVKMDTADVRIQKVDEDGNYVEGAELQILDENNNIVHSFTSGSNLIEINDILINGKEYTLHEVSAPSGYIKSNDVKFTTDKNQTNQTITMTDSKTKITINKVDQDGNNLSGAQLQILDGQNVIEEWTSGSQAHVISGKLDIGKQYTLHEVSAPAGYVLGEDQTFTFSENNKTITMTNVYKASGKTTIYVHKVLKGRNWKENDSFTFTLTAFEEAPMPDTTNVIIDNNSLNYTEAFGEIEFTKVGTYIYLVDEDCPSDMLCEDTKMITFNVTDNGDGTLAIASDVDDNIINFENNKKFEADLEKKVMDKNDTTGDKSNWQDSADYDIGDEVPFSLHTTLPENVTSYNEYHMKFYDSMENGLSFKEITKVVINGEEIPESDYVLTTNEHEFNLEIDFGDGNSKISDSTLNGAEIYIYYNLVLNEDAIIGEEGNVNKAYLEYSSNPKDKTETKKSEEDFAIVLTYKLQINKVDEDNNALDGAQFKLEKKMANGNKVLVKKFDFNSESTFIFNGIDDGEYILTETVSPQGYNPIDPIEFIVVAEHEVLISSVDEEILTELSVESQTDIDLDPSIDGGNILINIVNKETEIKIIKQDEQGTSIQGAELQILDEYDSVIDTWTSDGSAHVVTGLTAGKTYTLHEKTPPDGYALSEDVEFTVNNEENQTITMTDKKTKMNILKTDEDNNPLDGAVLQVKDGSTVIDSWTSTTSTHEINGVLTAGKTYTLEEVTPPNGYAKAVSKQFTVPTDGSDITVTMSDTKTKLEVTKVDNKNNNISGVVLQILDATDNSVVQEWTTTKNPKTIEGLTAGHGYILHEVSSPDGYALSEDISFTMNTDIGTQQIVMTDESTKVYIKKVNVDGEEIEGAKLQILSGSTVIDEWTTTAGSTHEIIGVLGAEKKYTLHEVSVPKGYVTAEDKEFTVPKGNETLEVEMLDNKTKVSLIKLDMKSGKPLAGSHLQVIDKDNNILFEFVSTEEKVVLEGLLEVGEKYRLHEAGAPNLYQRNVDVEFTVGDTDEEIEVEISDDKTLLSIEKTDEKGNKISGALLQIIDSKGNVIKEFTSSEKAEELYGVLNELETYTLHEEKVPEGYLKAEDIKFKIDEEGKVNIYEGEEFKQQKENVIKMVDKKFENPKTTYKKIIVVFLLMMIVLTAMGILNKKTV